MLEQQQTRLVQALEELYRRSFEAGLWTGPVLRETNGHPLTHDLLKALHVAEDTEDGRSQSSPTQSTPPSSQLASPALDADVYSESSSAVLAPCIEGSSTAETDRRVQASDYSPWVVDQDAVSMVEAPNMPSAQYYAPSLATHLLPTGTSADYYAQNAPTGCTVADKRWLDDMEEISECKLERLWDVGYDFTWTADLKHLLQDKTTRLMDLDLLICAMRSGTDQSSTMLLASLRLGASVDHLAQSIRTGLANPKAST